MSAPELLEDLRRRGVDLNAANGKLRYRGKLTAEDLAALKANKAAILAALSKPAPTRDEITHHHIVPVDSLGLPFKPCSCGYHHFWSADGKVWYCSSCCPDRPQLGHTLTL
jgi:hypothetical protein